MFPYKVAGGSFGCESEEEEEKREPRPPARPGFRSFPYGIVSSTKLMRKVNAPEKTHPLAAVGNSINTTVPSPTPLENHMRPPLISAYRAALDKPRPRPRPAGR